MSPAAYPWICLGFASLSAVMLAAETSMAVAEGASLRVAGANHLGGALRDEVEPRLLALPDGAQLRLLPWPATRANAPPKAVIPLEEGTATPLCIAWGPAAVCPSLLAVAGPRTLEIFQVTARPAGAKSGGGTAVSAIAVASRCVRDAAAARTAPPITARSTRHAPPTPPSSPPAAGPWLPGRSGSHGTRPPRRARCWSGTSKAPACSASARRRRARCCWSRLSSA